MKCNYCGTELNEDLKFCPVCGANLPDRSSKNKENNPEQRPSNPVFPNGDVLPDAKPDFVNQSPLDFKGEFGSLTPVKKSKKPIIVLGLVALLAMLVLFTIVFSMGIKSGKNMVANNEASSTEAVLQKTEAGQSEDMEEATEVAEEATEEAAEEATEAAQEQAYGAETGSSSWEGINFSIQRTGETQALLTIECEDTSGDYYFGPHMEFESPVILEMADGSQVKTTLSKDLFFQENNSMNFVTGNNVTMVLEFDDGAKGQWDTVHLSVTSLQLALENNDKDIAIEVN